MLQFNFPKWAEDGKPSLQYFVRRCSGCSELIEARLTAESALPQINKGCKCTGGIANWRRMPHEAWASVCEAREDFRYLLDTSFKEKAIAANTPKKFNVQLVHHPIEKGKPYKATVNGEGFEYYAEAATPSEALLLLAAHWHSNKTD